MELDRKTLAFGAVLIIAGLAVTGNLPTDIQLSSPFAGDSDSQNGDGAVVDDWELSSQVNFPQAPSSADIHLFAERPDKFGNYVEWDASQATSGLSQGQDYYATTGATSKSVDLGYIPSGTYYMVVEDANYQTKFAEVTVPETVGQAFAENDKKITLAQQGSFDLTATFGSDNVVLEDGDGNVLATGTDFPDASANQSEDLRIVRTIEVDTGVPYLGSYDVTSFNDGDGIENVDVTIKMNSDTYTKELKDGNTGELADSTSFGEDLVSDVETDPAMPTDEIQVIYDLTVDRNTAVASAGDGELGPGESLFTSGVDDIFGSDVSTATNSYTG